MKKESRLILNSDIFHPHISQLIVQWIIRKAADDELQVRKRWVHSHVGQSVKYTCCQLYILVLSFLYSCCQIYILYVSCTWLYTYLLSVIHILVVSYTHTCCQLYTYLLSVIHIFVVSYTYTYLLFFIRIFVRYTHTCCPLYTYLLPVIHILAVSYTHLLEDDLERSIDM